MNSRAELWVHFVWAVLDRRPAITSDAWTTIESVARAKALELQSPLRAIGGTSDHVHALLELHPKVAPSRLVGELKGASSHAVNHRRPSAGTLRWQSGYACFSVSTAEVPLIESYVLDQASRHRDGRTTPTLEFSPALVPARVCDSTADDRVRTEALRRRA